MEQAKAREIAELMNENQRLYTEVNLKRRLISQLAITYNFSIWDLWIIFGHSRSNDIICIRYG